MTDRHSIKTNDRSIVLFDKEKAKPWYKLINSPEPMAEAKKLYNEVDLISTILIDIESNGKTTKSEISVYPATYDDGFVTKLE